MTDAERQGGRRPSRPPTTARQAGRIVRGLMRAAKEAMPAEPDTPERDRPAGRVVEGQVLPPPGGRDRRPTAETGEPSVRLGPPRWMVLVVGLVLVGLGGADYVLPGGMPEEMALICGASLKVGVVMCLAWLAWPQVAMVASLLPAWFVGLTLVCLLAIVVRPALALYLIPLYLTVAAIQFGGDASRWMMGKPPPRDDSA